MTTQTLAKPLRGQLEAAVKSARDVSEKAAAAALSQLAVVEAKAPDYLSDELKSLRRRLRAHGRALGDVKAKDDTQPVRHLVWEVAYEHWHRMLFARFLAENGLLMWEPGAPVSLDDCRDMVDSHPEMAMGAKSAWELAGRLAARMLPQVFKPNSPVFELVFAPEHQRELERMLAALPPEVFRASDSLGWVYQFWQSKRKDEVNASEVKIGADELPAVTQLFTEPYMVDFLLHNSLGAWWVTRHPGKTCPVPLTYLRTLDDGTPAAGKFEGWPDRLEDFKLLDPCCGSGHFLVAAFLLLVPMRMAAEGLSAMDAVDAVLADNLHGLEIDARCVEVAAFSLALNAWRFGDSGQYRELPPLNIACVGLSIACSKDEWLELAHGANGVAAALENFYYAFKHAPLIGSLIDFDQIQGVNSLFSVAEEDFWPRLTEALASIDDANVDARERGVVAQGLSMAAKILGQHYDFVVTNPPYLTRSKQNPQLQKLLRSYFGPGDADIATVFLKRFEGFLNPGGVHASVTPLNWYFLKSYEVLRKYLLTDMRINLLAKVGSGATAKASWDVLRALAIITKAPPDDSSPISGIEATSSDEESRALELRYCMVTCSSSRRMLANPDTKFVLGIPEGARLLQEDATSYAGLQSGDTASFCRKFWEVALSSGDWIYQQGTFESSDLYCGLEHVIYWEQGQGRLSCHPSARIQGLQAHGKRGVAITQTRKLPATLYLGTFYDNNVAVIVPKRESDLEALWAYCSSSEFNRDVRKLDEKLGVTNSTLTKVAFDVSRWRVAASALPKPYSDDPTQWLFHGHPQVATDPLQVAVARLAGYRWPAECDASMELADEARTWIGRCEILAEHTDDDGIVCLPSVRGELPAHDRLLKLLIASWETVQPGSWKPAVLDKLLADSDCAGKGLDVWLREKFFEQHAKRFHHRPFIWHVWDGLKDGFAALVNYHQLDAKNLERLIHTYLGDWIRQQEAGVRDGVDGSQTRLAAAQDLKRRLELILEGEPPFDIFVRWKPLAEQPIGWNPDLNDGVRMNIRPFMTAEVLRHNKKPKLNITWDKDRGKDVESAPWFKVFEGERINDQHLTLAEKRALPPQQ